MSEYSYQKVSQDEFVIYAPDGRVVGKEVFKALAQDKVEILNAETAPLLERIAALEAALEEITTFNVWNNDHSVTMQTIAREALDKKAGDNGN